MSALRCALGAVVLPLSTASPCSPARKMSSAEARRPPTTPRSPGRGGSRKTHRVSWSSTRMEEPAGNLPIRRDVILPESCCDHVTITNLH
ncbi:protein TSSC4 isoform X3 [Vidua macroura]|uniref:protein TSSC4 isoform X3 n=1 Tax=Vidua macroura TaxID=187451 RepID=UPI0023A7A606|nr:protein TSSC4 isoform X3 [Vidua macroura]